MLQEKKISSKINYDILRTLTAPKVNEESVDPPSADEQRIQGDEGDENSSVIMSGSR